MKKTMKKLASLALVLVMALALAVPALATAGGGDGAGGNNTSGGSSSTANNNPGQITIEAPDGASDILGENEKLTYKVYKIFDLTFSTDEDGDQTATATNFSYTANSTIKGLIEGIQDGSEYAAVKGYFTFAPIAGVNNSWTVTPKGDFADSEKSAAAAKTFSQFLKTNVDSLGTVVSTVELDKGDTSKTINVPYGYYFVDSTVGSLCMLDSTNPSVTITDKNDLPSIDKKVEVPTGTTIGGTVHYTIDVPLVKGAQDYVISDTLSEGLDYISKSIVIEMYDDENKPAGWSTQSDNVTSNFYSFETLTDEEEQAGVIFKVKLSEGVHAFGDFGGWKVVISYDATINEKALITSERGEDSNTWNTATLQYGHDPKTISKTVDFDLYKFDLVKTDSKGAELQGAKFTLWDSNEGGQEIKVVWVADEENQSGYYRPAMENENESVAATEIVAGNVTVKGLANGTYYLQEETAPDGYNKLPTRVKVEIESQDLTANQQSGTDDDGNTTITWGSAIRVVNYTGSELPSTGGMGTKIFTIGGSILVVGAAVLLITKKRMGSDN